MSLSEYPALPYDNGEQYVPAGSASTVRVGLDGSAYVQNFNGVEDLTIVRSHSLISRAQLDELIEFYRQNFGLWFYISDPSNKVYLGCFTGIPKWKHERGPWWSASVPLLLRNPELDQVEYA